MRRARSGNHKLPSLWKCPKCGAKLVTRNLSHACGKFSLQALFAKSQPHVRRVFNRYVMEVRKFGPVTVIPQKSRIVFMTRMRFAGGTPRRTYFAGRFLLNRRVHSPRFTRVLQYGPRSFDYHLRMDSERVFDAELRDWLREAYRIGQQDKET